MTLPGRVHSYAYWRSTQEPETGLPVRGLGSHRYTIFPRPVLLKAMEIIRAPDCCGGRPEQVAIESYSGPEPRGQILFEGQLPWGQDGVCRLEFPNVSVCAVSQRCHWRSPVREQFMEWHPTRYTVPFNIFDGTRWLGDPDVKQAAPEPPAPPVLERGAIEPEGHGDMQARTDGMFVHYRSRMLKIGFSLVRPRISFLAWDGPGTDRVEKNFLAESSARGEFGPAPASGPWRRNLAFDLPPMLWTGAVEVKGRHVKYSGLRSAGGFTMDVDFEIESGGFTMRVRQHNEKEQLFLEAEAWRLIWDGDRVNSLSTLAMPLDGHHRNGLVEPCGGWHCANQGTLSFRSTAGSPAGMQIDTSGFGGRQGFAGLLVGARPEPHGPVSMLAGEHCVDMEFRVANVEPALTEKARKLPPHPGLRRAWGSIFAFRPEHGGFSNNSFGVNAENCLYLVADLAPYTRSSPPLPSMTWLLRHTLESALKGGPGYACFPEEAHDTAPSQLITAGRVYQAERNRKWVQDIWPFLERRIRHILNNLNEDGFYICRRLSGNSNSFHTSSNAWDTFCFGHADGYSGALAYRGLRNAEILSKVAADFPLAQQCSESAQRLRAAFVPTLFNPETGWLAGWRSADGALHDYAMPFITALAAIYDILDESQARQMLEKLERKRLAKGLNDFRHGLSPQFDPVPARDHWAEGGWVRAEVPYRADGADTYGIFTNGGLTPCLAGFHVRALSRFGFKEVADRICDQLLESFDQGVFEGCLNGAECFTLDGMPSGYEGTLSHSYHVLLAIAQHRGWVKTLDPEWWPLE